MAMTDEELDDYITSYFGSSVNAFNNARMRTALREIIADMRAIVVSGGGISLGESSATAYRGDRGKIAYDHSLSTSNPHSVTKTQVGLGSVDNTSDLSKPISTLTQSALDGKSAVGHTHTSSQVTDFTEAVQDAVAALLGAGSNVILNYDDTAGTLSISATGEGGTGLSAEEVRDAIGVALVGVGNIAVTVNDAADTITITTTATVNDTNANLRDRTTHTGVQAISTVSGLQALLDIKAETYNTRALLIATRPAAGSLAHSLGYYAANDGGGASYYFDASSTETSDGNAIITPTTGSGAGRWKLLTPGNYLNARWFGATGDGSTDDTTALQAFLDFGTYTRRGMRMEWPDGVCKTTDTLTIGQETTPFDPYNENSFYLYGAGISSDPNQATPDGNPGTQIRYYGSSTNAIISLQRGAARYQVMEGFTVVSNTRGAATHGILWDDTRFSMPRLRNVHSQACKRAFSIVRVTGLNGEFITFDKCGGTGTERFFYMNDNILTGQSFGHKFDHCNMGVDDGGALFEIGGEALGFGITLVDCHSSSIGSSTEVSALYGAGTLQGVTFLKNNGISGYFTVIDGRHEHVSTIIDNNSASYNEAGRITFFGTEFDGMMSTVARPVIKTTAGFAGAYSVLFDNCSLNRFGFGYEDQSVFHISLSNIDATQWKFKNTLINFNTVDVSQTWFSRVDFENCIQPTPNGRPQIFSNATERVQDLSARSSVSNIRQAQGRPRNLLRHSGFTVDSLTAPSPWVHTGGNFSATVKAFPHADVASWSSSPNARLITLAAGGAVYQDIDEINFQTGGAHQPLSGLTTGYYQGQIGFSGTVSYTLFEISLENATTGRVYQKRRFNSPDHEVTYNINMVAVDADQGTSQKLRLKIACLSGTATGLRLYSQMITEDPYTVYAPTTADAVDYDHAWDLNTDLVKVDGRLQLPVKADTLNNPANLPNHRAGELAWSSTQNGAIVSDGTTNIQLAGVEIVATKADVSASTVKRLVYVTADEDNNDDTSLYIHNGTTLKFLQTIA